MEIKKTNNFRKKIIKEHFSRSAKDWDALYSNSDEKESFTKFELRRRKEIVVNFIEKINSERNSIVVNFRGRLLNDILNCMITTCYKKK